MRKPFATFVLILIAYILPAQNGTEPVKITDMLKIKTVSGITLNKEGSKGLFTLTSIEPENDSRYEYKYVNQLWLASLTDSPSLKQLTFRDNASQAAWSPDGKHIAFVRNTEGKQQIFLLPLDGGEALQLTRLTYGASNPVWSPDGKRLLFSASVPLKDLLQDNQLNPHKTPPVWPYEKPGFSSNDHLLSSSKASDPDGDMDEIRAYLNINVIDKKARVVNKLNFQNESDVSTEMNFTHYYIMEVKPDAVPVPVTKGFYRFNYAAFTPDGKQLVIGGDMDSLQHPDRSLEGQIYLVNADGSNWKKLLGEEGVNYQSPRLSPSGKWLAFQYSNTSFVSVPTLAIMPLGGTIKDKSDYPFDRNKGNLVWSGDERYIYFSTPSNGGNPVYRMDIKTKKAEQLTGFESGVSSFDIRGNRLLFAKTEVANPSELYLTDASGKSAKQISNFNTEWLKNKAISYPEKRTFKNSIGQTVEYWVMKPARFDPAKKYPLLLEIHGGPSSMWGPGESSMWHEYQYFCSQGYGVVYSNPRGSGGYGLDFLRSNINDWGAGPASDVLTALDLTTRKENWADTSRLFITGGSYAGYLVTWIIAHDQRFRAACAQRGVYDLATFFGEGNAWRLVPNYFDGYPWEPATRTTLDRESPIKYVHNINTPLIIFHGENDRRTGVIQSEMLYRSLKVLKKPVEYVRHPNATHEITRTGNNRQRIDQMLRTFEFFERWNK